MIVSSLKGLRVADVAFDEEVQASNIDLVRYLQYSSPPPGAKCTEFPTIVIDLSTAVERLEKGLERDCRYDIRRAERDGVQWSYSLSPDESELQQFCRDYEEMFHKKRLRWSSPARRLVSLKSANVLCMTRAHDSQGRTLVWHVYLYVNRRARLLHSVSLYRNSTQAHDRQMTGRANRFSHWRDIIWFREAHCDQLDLGGWYTGSSDQQLLKINRFKADFGGRTEVTYNGIKGLTTRGKLAAMYLFWRSTT